MHTLYTHTQVAGLDITLDGYLPVFASFEGNATKGTTVTAGAFYRYEKEYGMGYVSNPNLVTMPGGQLLQEKCPTVATAAGW
jgi:hypothetical protein